MSKVDIKLLPVGLQDFEEIRRRRNVYVDKSSYLKSIADVDSSPVFISRPRRFGKSLLLSTFKSLFEHGTEYFKGLDIEKSWKENTYKVVSLDFSIFSDEGYDIDEFDRLFCNQLLDRFELLSDEELRKYSRPQFLLDKILSEMDPMSLVLLIDEYDAPMTNSMNNAELYKERIRSINRFFSILKTYTSKFRFILITGVSRYKNVSVFSGLNNVVDISMNKEYNSLLGYTDYEIDRYFDRYIENAASVFDTTVSKIREGIKINYNGYCFDWNCSAPIYNPWSVLRFLLLPSKGRPFQDYWNESAGISTLIVKYFKERTRIPGDAKYSLSILDSTISDGLVVDINDLYLRTDSPSDLKPEILLLQTGYYTLRKIDGTDAYISVPNEEVRSALRNLFFSEIMRNDDSILPFIISYPKSSIQDIFDLGDISGIRNFLERLFTTFSYDSRIFSGKEALLRDICYTFLRARNVFCSREDPTLYGRSDLIIEPAPEHRIVIEFKIARDGGATPRRLLDQAIRQIVDRGYGNVVPTAKLDRYAVVVCPSSDRSRAEILVERA